MKGVETTIAEGSHGQLLVTIPKQVAKYVGITKGHKVKWYPENGKMVGEVEI